MSFIKDFYKYTSLNQTVFTLTELSNINSSYTGPKLNSAIKYLVKNNDLIRISKSIYALNENYSRQEFANKFRTPSYISLYTVLSESGIVFQPYESIYLLSKRSEKKDIKGISLIYKNIKDEILLNPFGINSLNNIFKASKERAICDTLYIYGNQYFDNLREIDLQLLKDINRYVYNNYKPIEKWILQNIKQI